MSLPTVIASSVVRVSKPGEAHGHLFLVDLERQAYRCVLEWADAQISWDGRGRDRGLRGIAFHDGRILIAASAQVVIFSPDFQRLGSIRSDYLGNCHEIEIHEGLLYLTSTAFNAILVYDLAAQRFVAGYHLGYAGLAKAIKKLGGRPMPRLRTFDPNQPGGPTRDGHLHINSVRPHDGAILVSGTHMGRVVAVRNGNVECFGLIPFKSHNVRPFGDGLLLNDTPRSRIAHTDRGARDREAFDAAVGQTPDMEHADLPAVIARPGFARGLALGEDGLIIGGSSPATVSAYRPGCATPRVSVHLSRDLRNAVHGLEIWPFD